MNTYLLRDNIVVNRYKKFIESFGYIRNHVISEKVELWFTNNNIIPEPLVQFNPFYKASLGISGLVAELSLSEELNNVFPDFIFHEHQYQATKIANHEKDFIVTSGTGSGKSLTYLISIIDYCIKQREAGNLGIKAILVYPMNALLNSQKEEINKYLVNWYQKKFSNKLVHHTDVNDLKKLEELTNTPPPFSYSPYSGQEDSGQRSVACKSDIILTNYMMMELIMTRAGEETLRGNFQGTLKYLVFDELHTYRGRQGADVAMLIKRIKGSTNKSTNLMTIGTSATMATGNTSTSRKHEIRKFAEKIFGVPFEEEQIIEESLRLQTEPVHTNDIKKCLNEPQSILDFTKSPLAALIERSIATLEEDAMLVRNTPLTIAEMAKKLGIADEAELKNFLTHLENSNAKLGRDKRVLPFRLHQFISQTGTVKATLEPSEKAVVAVTDEIYGGDNAQFFLYELVFSRITGKAFYCVTAVKTDKQTIYKRRKFGDLLPDIEDHENSTSRGYLILDSELRYGIDPSTDPEDYWSIENLPDTWKTFSKRQNKTILKTDKINGLSKADRLPKPVWINGFGESLTAEDTDATKAWFMPERLLLDPTCGVTYSRESEFLKLGRLGAEGRSTATTIISLLSIVEQNALDNQGPKKLLSFTDNRQDASLQAGHFNDFIAIVKLRTAVYQALSDEQPYNLNQLVDKVFEILEYSPEELKYGVNNTADLLFGRGRNQVIEAFKELIQYRILEDLKNGWRIIQPNLEQTGLLKIEYDQLDHELTENAHEWERSDLIKSLPLDSRKEFLEQILHYFRKSKAIANPVHFYRQTTNLQNFKSNIEEFVSRENPYAFEFTEVLDEPFFAFTQKNEDQNVPSISIGPLSALAKFLKRMAQHSGHIIEDVSVCMVEICDILTSFGYLQAKNNADKIKGYRLDPNCVKWLKGNGTSTDLVPDLVRVNVPVKEFDQYRKNLRVNSFFSDLYSSVKLDKNLRLVAREHTGQISTIDRQEREKDFRSPAGKIGALYCSPTMELGIDISDLSVVNMRNVPPLPSNYAQRSGRAGRSGQNALVLTYCSSTSPHDIHYFKHQKDMVKGVVKPPNLDMENQDLIRTHLHAFIFMKLRLEIPSPPPDRSLKTSFGLNSVAALVQLNHDLLLRDEIADLITANVEKEVESWTDEFHSMLDKDMRARFERATILNWAKDFGSTLNKSLDRWRKLFTSANQENLDAFAAFHRNQNDKAAKIRRHHSDLTLAILKCLKSNTKSGDEGNSEFGLYRYLASEGFLPGYNFPKLPTRAFMMKSGSTDSAEVISRARMVALSEYGPQNYIYHNGSKYQVGKFVRLSTDGFNPESLKISQESGYAVYDYKQVTHCPITKHEFKDHIHGLLQLDDVEAQARVKINSQEEERLKYGYDVKRYFEFSSGGMRLIEATVGTEDNSILSLKYDQAAKIIAVNQGLRINKQGEQGFRFDKSTGVWLTNTNYDPANENHKQVKLYTFTTNDILYIEPTKHLGLPEAGVRSLAYALKLGIEREFSVESNEISVELIGTNNNILIYENAEGSLGVLGRLVKEPDVFEKVCLEALHACQYATFKDPVTGDFIIKDETENAPKASYDNLLSFYNQRDHEVLDRAFVQQAMEKLLKLKLTPKEQDYQMQFNRLWEAHDKNSELEGRFLTYLKHNQLRLPDKAQVRIPGLFVEADFIYSFQGQQILIFIDGSVHDTPEMKVIDTCKRSNCEQDGYEVVVWHHQELIEAFIGRYSRIFSR